jgi:hypothetical protein
VLAQKFELAEVYKSKEKTVLFRLRQGDFVVEGDFFLGKSFAGLVAEGRKQLQALEQVSSRAELEHEHSRLFHDLQYYENYARESYASQQ